MKTITKESKLLKKHVFEIYTLLKFIKIQNLYWNLCFFYYNSIISNFRLHDRHERTKKDFQRLKSFTIFRLTLNPCFFLFMNQSVFNTAI